MWTTKNRARYERRGLRYQSHLIGEEWALIGPLIPAAKRGCNKRTVEGAFGRERRDACAEHRMPVDRRAQGHAGAKHGERLFSAQGLSVCPGTS